MRTSTEDPGYRPSVFVDPAQFESEMLDKIRQHFRAFRGSDNVPQGVRSRWCIAIDGGSSQSIIGHPGPQRGVRKAAG